MAGPQDPDDLRNDPDRLLDATLRAAFELDPMATPHMGDSVLEGLGDRFDRSVRLRDLHDPRPGQESGDDTGLQTEESGEGRYLILGEIARGGLGIVMNGRDNDIGRNVAVKLLLERHATNPDMINRLVEEAQIGGQLQHPGIVPVYDLGLRADRRPFFTMKLIRGETLAALLDARKDPDENQMRFLRIFEQACQTMAYAHARGVIHRDLKPSNIMVGAFGEVQLVDWGLAKALDRQDTSRSGRGVDACPDSEFREDDATDKVRTPSRDLGSRTGSVMGTFAYMAPEQARGEIDRLDERCDVFGLGAILCEILTGKPPFHGRTSKEAREQVRQGILEPCRKRLEESHADRRLVAFNRKCLAPDLDDRPRDAGLVAREIEDYLAETAERSRRAELEAAESRGRAEEAEIKVLHQRRANRRGLLLAAAVIVVVVLGAWIEISRRQRTAAAAEAVTKALARAGLLRSEAQAADPGNLDSWERAIEAGRNARNLLRTAGGGRDLEKRVESFLADLAKEEASARRDSIMIRRLDAIRSHIGGDWKLKDNAYSDAFREYGIPIEELDAVTASSAIGCSGIRNELVIGLDEWFDVRKKTGMNDTLLRSLVEAADVDPWKRALREASLEGDLIRIKSLSEKKTAGELLPVEAYTLALVLNDVGEKESAVSMMSEAARKHPDDFWTQFKAGCLLAELKPPRTQKAIEYFRAAVSLRPMSAAAWSNLGDALLHTGRKEESHRALRHALSLNPDDPVTRHFHIHFLCEFTKDYDRAIEEIEKALRLDQEDSSAYAYLGLVWHFRGDIEKARAAYETALKFDPSDAFSLCNMALILLDRGDLDGALGRLQKAISANPEEKIIHFNKGVILEAQGKSEEAIAAYRVAIVVEPTNADAHQNLGQLLDEKGEADEARALLRRALEIDPNHDGSLNDMGLSCLRTGELDKAIEYIDRAIAIDPEFGGYHYNLGLVHRKMGDLPRARDCMHTALTLEPGLVDLRHDLGTVYYELHDLDQARVLWEELVRDHRDDARTWYDLADMLFDSGLLDEALNAYEQVNRIGQNAEAWNGIGCVHMRRGDVLAACAAFSNVVDLAPDHNYAHGNLGIGYLRLGLLSEAEDSLKKAVKANPQNTNPLFNLGNLWLETGNVQQAIDAFWDVIGKNQHHFDAFIDLGFAYQRAGRFSDALAAMRRARELAEDRPDLSFDSWIKESERMVSLSVRLFEYLDGTLNLNDPEYLVLLARVCGASGHHAAATRFWKEALTARPELGADRWKSYWLHAARSAALASAKGGIDGGTLNEENLTSLRQQSLHWLEQHLALWKRVHDQGDEYGYNTMKWALGVIRIHPDLKPICDPQALAALSDNERTAFRSFWKRVDALLNE